MDTTKGNVKGYVLQLQANIYGQKQAGKMWDNYLMSVAFFRDNIIFIIYEDDEIFLGTFNDQLSHAIKELMDRGLQIEDQGHLADYVGVNIK
ncbi:hypothetical protein ACHAW6_001260 [Cyclotella cf. meneghiniana]